MDTQLTPLSCTVEGDYADVEVATTWTSVRSQPDDQLQYVGRSALRLKRSPYDGWDVVQAKVAGWDSSPV
ncbi:MAG: hypothetical protein R2867_36785 [Caldilineaceae bacterium]